MVLDRTGAGCRYNAVLLNRSLAVPEPKFSIAIINALQ